MTGYIHGERSRSNIINAGIALWHEKGERGVTARALGRKVGLSHAGVIYHFDSAAKMIDAIKREAIARGDKRIIPQLIVGADPLVAGWTQEQRQAWLSAAG